MKFTLATLSLAFASVKGASLRTVADKPNEATSNEHQQVNQKHIGSKIVLQGTTGEPSPEDLEFIGKALVSSYNDVHWDVGHFMNGADSIVHNTAPNSGTFTVDAPVLIWLWPGFLCRHCPDDDAMGAAQQSLLLTAVSEDCAGLCNKEATAELEVNFCDRIKSSQGSKYLASTSACSISFDSKDVQTDSEIVNDERNDPVATLDTTIVLKGVGAGEATQEEQAILAKAFVAAYNDVHWKDHHYLNDAQIPFIATNEASSDSNTLALDIVTPVMIWLWPGFLCRHCPDDDAMGAAAAGANFDVQAIRSNAFDKEAVEVAFCRKIQNNSVSTKLASVESCALAVETILG